MSTDFHGYIDAEAFAKSLEEIAFNPKNQNVLVCKTLEKVAGYAREEFPASDVVAVVRCKDCKHYDDLNHQCYLWDSARLMPNPCDYCSFGENGMTE